MKTCSLEGSSRCHHSSMSGAMAGECPGVLRLERAQHEGKCILQGAEGGFYKL